jgi:hypothetical protein
LAAPYGQFYENALPTGALRFLTGSFPFVPLPFVASVVPLPSILPLPTVPQLVTRAKGFSDQGLIDNVSNINGSKVFVYSGKTDKVVNHGRYEIIIFTSI